MLFIVSMYRISFYVTLVQLTRLLQAT